jgi:hypothetical protein
MAAQRRWGKLSYRDGTLFISWETKSGRLSQPLPVAMAEVDRDLVNWRGPGTFSVELEVEDGKPRRIRPGGKEWYPAPRAGGPGSGRGAGEKLIAVVPEPERGISGQECPACGAMRLTVTSRLTPGGVIRGPYGTAEVPPMLVAEMKCSECGWSARPHVRRDQAGL